VRHTLIVTFSRLVRTGPAPESITDKIFVHTESITSYKIAGEELKVRHARLQRHDLPTRSRASSL